MNKKVPLIGLIVLSIILATGQTPAYADTLILKDGRKIEGLILEEQKDAYIIKIKIGTAKIDKNMIQEIKKLPKEENYLNLGDQYAASHNYEAALEQYKKALEVNPGFQPAREAATNTEKIINTAKEKQHLELSGKGNEFPGKKEAVAKSSGLKLEGTDQFEVNLTRKKMDYQKRIFVGVGIFLDSEGNNLVINNIIPGEPADLAGLKLKDKVMSIDDKSTVGLSVDDAAALIGGSENSSVKLIIQRSIDLERK